MHHARNEDDPYLTAQPDDDDEDLEDFVIRATDMMLVCGVTEEDELSHLDVLIVPDGLSEFGVDMEKLEANPEAQVTQLSSFAPPDPYVHHDYLLPAFPLSLAWLPVPNMVAVGTMESDIELWNLDMVEAPEPTALLSGHSQSVLSLHTHPSFSGSATSQAMPLLASGSADGLVKLWDITRAAPSNNNSNDNSNDDGSDNNSNACVHTLSHHQVNQDKVQAVRWHPSEGSILASASLGSQPSLCIVDARAPSGQGVMRLALPSDAEALEWLSSQHVLVSTEDGHVICVDIMKIGQQQQLSSASLWQLGAHTGPCSGMALTAPPAGSGVDPSRIILATCSPGKTTPLKLWAIRPNQGPTCLFSKTDELGKLFNVSFNPQVPYLLAAGAASQLPALINILDWAPVERYWQSGDVVPSFSTSFGGNANSSSSSASSGRGGNAKTKSNNKFSKR
jgi:periodic tryptophan protein 1